MKNKPKTKIDDVQGLTDTLCRIPMSDIGKILESSHPMQTLGMYTLLCYLLHCEQSEQTTLRGCILNDCEVMITIDDLACYCCTCHDTAAKYMRMLIDMQLVKHIHPYPSDTRFSIFRLLSFANKEKSFPPDPLSKKK